jgi:hypothetical protein
MAKIYGQASGYLIKQERWNWRLGFICATASFLILYVISYRYLTFGTASVIAVSVLLPIVWALTKGQKYFLEIADRFRRGRKGEGSVYFVLRDKLPPPFIVFEDVNISNKGNIDFVVIGPTGIFAIDVKSYKGEILFNGKNLLINEKPFRKNILGQVKAEAFELNQYLKSKIEWDYFVKPVLVFSNHKSFMQFGFRPVDGVFVIKTPFLVELLTKGPRVLTAEAMTEIEERMKSVVKLGPYTYK